MALLQGKRARDNDEVSLGNTSHTWRDDRLAGLWRQGVLCDIEVLAGGESFQAHRIVLAAASEFFAALLSGSWHDSTGPVALPDLEPAAFAVVLEWMYTGSASCSTAILPAVLRASAHLHSAPLQREVERGAISLIRAGRAACASSSTYLDMGTRCPLLWWQLADTLDMGKLCAEAKRAALATFESVAASEAF